MSQKSDKTTNKNNDNDNNNNDDIMIIARGRQGAASGFILNNHTDNLDMINDLLPISERNLTIESNGSNEILENTRSISMDNNNKISGTPPTFSSSEDHSTNNNTNIHTNNEVTVHINEQTAVNKREENPFSFKHFLKSDNSNSSNNSLNKNATTTTITTTTITTTPHIPSTSTGARPKILQHPPISQQYQPYNNNNNTTTIESTKMKRSPRFSSFDSHASLTKYATDNNSNNNYTTTTNNNNINNYNRSSGGDGSLSMTNLFHNGINEFDSNATTTTTHDNNNNNNNDYDNDIINNELRFTTLSLNAAAEMLGGKNVSSGSSSSRHIDTPQTIEAINKKPRSISQQNLYNNHHHHQHQHHNHHHHNNQNNNCTGRTNNTTTNEFSSALPDFVQDHIVLEQWYTGSCTGGDGSHHNLTKNNSPLSLEFDRLPDFATSHDHHESLASSQPSTSIASVISSQQQQQQHHNQNIPFDLMYDHGVTRHRRNSSSTTAPIAATLQFDLPSTISKNVPLDLPNHNINFPSFTNYRNNNNNNINTNSVSNGVMSGFAVDDDTDDDDGDDVGGIGAVASAASSSINSIPMGNNVPLPNIDIVNRVLSNDIPLDLTSQYAVSDGAAAGAASSSSVVAPHQHHQNNLRQINQMPSNIFDQVQQSLPDFLSDGPIHSSSRLADVTLDLPLNDNLNIYSSNAMRANREASEIDKLRFELFYSRQEVYEQAAKIQELEQSLEIKRQQQSESSTNLDNLYKSNKRAEAAQKQVTRLKLLNTELTSQIELLKRENELLKEEGAVGGIIITEPIPSSTSSPSTRSTAATSQKSRYYEQNQQISRELLAAALNAESNLRQLLSGVENLRSIAHRIDDNVNLQPPLSQSRQQPSQEARQSGNGIGGGGGGGGGIGGASHNTIRIQNTSYNIEDFNSDCDDDDDEDFTGPAL